MVNFICPIKGNKVRLTSSFGWRTHPVTGKKNSFHQGIDLAMTPNTNVEIVASADGEVIRVGALGTYGNVVMIKHNINGKRMDTNYAHLKDNSIRVKVGQKVKQGQVIGIMGSTGSSTAPHLHFEIHNGAWATGQPNVVDPMKYITLNNQVKEESVKMKPTEIEIHAGHSLYVRGAKGLIDEVDEARKVGKRVYEILKSNNVPVTYFEDNTSKTQAQNLNTLVKHHNADKNGLIVSVHFNASGGITNSPIGTEVLYYDQKQLATNLSNAMAKSGGFKNRGAKPRKDLAVLASTNEPAILLEICFVNSKADVELYKKNFEDICYSIAQVLAESIGKKLNKTNKDGALSMSQYTELKKEIEELRKQLNNQDNSPSPWAKDAWDWGKEIEVGKGVKFVDGTNPKNFITREQVIVLFFRFFSKFIKK